MSFSNNTHSSTISTLEVALTGQETGPLVFFCSLCNNFLIGKLCFRHHLQHCQIELSSFLDLNQEHVDRSTNMISSEQYQWIGCFKCNRQLQMANDHKSKLKNWKGLIGWPRLAVMLLHLLRQRKVVSSVAKTGIWNLDLKYKLALFSVGTTGTRLIISNK